DIRPGATKEGIRNYVKTQTQWGDGPTIKFDKAPGLVNGAPGVYDPESNEITLNADYAVKLEKLLASDASPEAKQVAFMRFYMTLTHETAHRLNYPDKITNYKDNSQGQDEPV